MSTRNRFSLSLLVSLFLFAVAACRMTASHSSHDVALPQAWSPATGAPGAAQPPPERWWTEFGDPELDSLVERAVAANLDLVIARARCVEARAVRDVASSARLPSVDANAGYTRNQISGNSRQGAITGTSPYDLYEVGFDASWEIDLFGSQRSAVAAAQAGVEAADEGRRDTLVSLLGEVARSYVDLRGSQRQIALLRANSDAQAHTLELTRARFEAGLAPELDVARAQALLSNTEAAIPALEAQVSSAIHRLSILIAEPPASLGPELSEPKPVPVASATLARLDAGLPADLLRRRPDIRRAERELAQAAALSDQATADLYPKLTLGGSFGFQSIRAGHLFDSDSQAWSIGPSLLAPIFHGGALRAEVRAQGAREEAAIGLYRFTVLGALAEVEDALSSVARERERRASLSTALESTRRALELANDLHTRGLIDFFEVLDAERAVLIAEASLAQSETALTSQTVALYKALGGGWESQPDEAAAASSSPGAAPGGESGG
jgi:multidrug efflux system outer membrane protein